MSDVKQCPDQGLCYCPNCEKLEKRIKELEAQVEKEKKVFHYGYLPDDLKKIDDIEKELSELRKENERFKEALIQIRDTMEKDGGFPKTVPEINKVLNGEESERYESLRELLREACMGLEGSIDNEECCFDHHGYCQTHNVTAPCQNKVRKELLTRLKEAVK